MKRTVLNAVRSPLALANLTKHRKTLLEELVYYPVFSFFLKVLKGVLSSNDEHGQNRWNNTKHT